MKRNTPLMVMACFCVPFVLTYDVLPVKVELECAVLSQYQTTGINNDCSG
jgi:hypothetical protein